MSTIFRELTDNDIETVAKFHVDLVSYIKRETNDPYFNIEGFDINWLCDYVRTFLGSADRKIVVAATNDQVVGYIALESLSCFLPISTVKRVGYITGCFVLEQYRGQGIARRLTEIAEESFRVKGIKYIELNVLTKNTTAKRAWEQLGFSTFREHMRKEI